MTKEDLVDWFLLNGWAGVEERHGFSEISKKVVNQYGRVETVWVELWGSCIVYNDAHNNIITQYYEDLVSADDKVCAKISFY